MKTIAAELGVAETTVRRALRRVGLRRWPQRMLHDGDWLRTTHHTLDVPAVRIARWLNTTEVDVLVALRAHDVAVRPAPTTHGADRLFDLDWLQQRWVDDHASIEMIADQLDVSLLDARSALREAGLAHRR